MRNPFTFWQFAKQSEVAEAEKSYPQNIRARKDRQFKGDRFSHIRPSRLLGGVFRRNKMKHTASLYDYQSTITEVRRYRSRSGKSYAEMENGMVRRLNA